MNMTMKMTKMGKIMIIPSALIGFNRYGVNCTVERLRIQYAKPKKPTPIGGKISLGYTAERKNKQID